MSQKTNISSVENNLLMSEEKLYFKNIIICRCGEFHEFYVTFKKEHIVVFPCASVKLKDLNDSKDIRKKCECCENEILIERDYCKKKKSKTVFFCQKCNEKEELKKKNLTKLSDLTSSENDDGLRIKIKNKFEYFIENNGKAIENDFYKNNLAHLELLGHFIDYLCLLRKIFHEESIMHKILSNFLEYTEKIIDVASNNIQIYDLYHFNKETIIYSYNNDENKKFLSNTFKSNYRHLLIKCSKKKYLSNEMLKYIYEKYKKRELVDEEKKDIMNTKYLKKEKINIRKEVFSRASEPSKNYLFILSLFSEMTNELEIIKLKAKVTKLDQSLLLDKYINSYLNIPGQLSFFRKSSSIILDKIIKNNYEKLNFIKPNDKIIFLTCSLIERIKKKLMVDKKGEEKAVEISINKKLIALEKTLKKYNNKKKDYEKDSLSNLSYPIINFDEKEKKYLASLQEINKYGNNYSKISVENGEDLDLDFIINYLFELKDKTSKTIHVNDQENLKFYTFSKEMVKLPEYNEKDDLNQSLEKIKKILKMVPKYGETTYEELIDFLFNSETNGFLTKDDKIDYLLSFLELKSKKLSKIKEKYKEVGKIMDDISIKITKFVKVADYEIDKEKYHKFINKYIIKKNSKEIFEYLDNIVDYIIPIKLVDDKKRENETENENENSEDEDSEENYDKVKQQCFLDYYKIYENKEEKLRNNIIQLFEKDPKFISYISNYFWIKLAKYVEDNQQNFIEKFESTKSEIKNKYLQFLKLKETRGVVAELSIYNFNIKEHFKEFVDNYEGKLPQKKKKITGNISEEESITKFETFIKRLKGYLGNINENVKITGEEPGQFVFKLFLDKIGLNW